MEVHPATFSPRKNKSNRYCCVPQCTSKANRDITVRFHEFPRVGELVVIEDNWGSKETCDRRRLWIHKLKIGKNVTKSMVVCSKHFQRSDYILPDISAKHRNLKKNAVPSLNLPKTSSSPRCMPMKRRQDRNSVGNRQKQSMPEGGSQEISSIGSSNYHSKNNMEQHSNASTKENVEGSEFTSEYYIKEEIDETSDIQEENQTDALRDPLSLDPHIEECHQNIESLIKKEFPDTCTEEQPEVNSNSSVPWNPSDVIIQNIESLIKKEFPDTCTEEQPEVNSNSSVPWNPSGVFIQDDGIVIKKEFPDTCAEEGPETISCTPDISYVSIQESNEGLKKGNFL